MRCFRTEITHYIDGDTRHEERFFVCPTSNDTREVLKKIGGYLEITLSERDIAETKAEVPNASANGYKVVVRRGRPFKIDFFLRIKRITLQEV